MANLFLAAFSALALASAFLGQHAWPVPFVALIPFLHATYRVEKRDSFRLGFFWGALFFGPVLWWIAPTIANYGRLPMPAAWAIFALLVCYLALFPGLWAWLTRSFIAFKPGSLTAMLAISSLWILLEALRGSFLSGFPWAALGYSLSHSPWLIQTADLWGHYGIGFIVFFSNIVLWRLFLLFQKGDVTRERIGMASLSLAFWGVLMTFVFIYGDHMLSIAKEGRIRVAAIQGSFDQSIKWNPQYRHATIERYKRLTQEAKSRFPALGLVVWPETAMPFYFQEQGHLRQEIMGFAKELEISILFGGPSYFYDPGGHLRYRNSAFIVGPDGSFRGRYDKQHLVPFGEYMPWGRLTAWARDFLPTAGDFVAGTNSRPLVSKPFKIGVMICFESIFPAISRKEVLAGANILTVITNDAWFGRTAAPYQHADMAIFRAVETRRWLVRAANTGVSRIISPQGRISASTDLFKPCYITGLVDIDYGITPFVRYGAHWFLALNLLFVLINYFITSSNITKGDIHGR